MHQPVDGRGGGHRVLEDAVPLAEDEVAADQYAFALIAFSEEGKQYLDLIAVLLEIPDVIEDDHSIAVEAAQFFFQAQFLFGAEQALHQLERGGKEDPVAPFDEGLADGAEQMGLTPSGQAKGEDIMGSPDKVALTESGQLSTYRLGQTG